MDIYRNVMLIPFEEERIVIMNGEKYLAVDVQEMKKIKSSREPAEYNWTDDTQEAVLKILEDTPNLKNNQIRTILREKYEMNPSSNGMRSLLGRMKNKGLIQVFGTKNTARWSVKKTYPRGNDE